MWWKEFRVNYNRTYDVCKNFLSCFDGKRYIVDNG